MMEQLKCKSCGGNLNSNGVCPFCGSKYVVPSCKAELNPYRRDEVKLNCEIAVPFSTRMQLTNDMGMILIKQRAAQQFSEMLEPYIDVKIFESVRDPLGDMTAVASITLIHK